MFLLFASTSDVEQIGFQLSLESVQRPIRTKYHQTKTTGQLPFVLTAFVGIGAMAGWI